ncbi:MAG: tRNA-dihydrouridine synthase [Roseburia sp.]|nr:tRNA-dihydrouridine synthase [Roseburia sp.]
MTDAGGEIIKIGALDVGRVWLAPMAGYTDIAFRELCRECGAGLTVTEMVSVRGLVHGSAATEKLMRTAKNERPSCIQVFGSDPNDFARAADMLDGDIIDVNMGCPMPKIVKNGDGAALLKSPKRAGEIVRALKNSTDKPITVKTRLGYAVGEDSAEELIAAVAEAGATAVTVHGRYAEQRYTGRADYEKAEKLARASRIPIILNGDIDEDNIDGLLKPPFAAVAVGRAALGNPEIFSRRRCDPFVMARRHVELLSTYFDERYTVNQARKFFVHYFKGASGGKAIRAAVNAASSVKEVLDILELDKRMQY